MPDKPPTQLECFVLAFVRRHQPITGYAVRQFIAKTYSSTFSSSAGSIYPLLARLEKRGLLSSEDSATGHRRHVLLSVTKDGRKAIAVWLKPPFEPGEVYPEDPLRTRAHLLEFLNPKQRREWIAGARDAITEQNRIVKDGLAQAETRPDGPDRIWPGISTDHVVRINKARLAWLDAVERAFEEAGA